MRLTLTMAPVVPDPKRIKEFRTEAAFEAWMRRHHAREPEIWLRIYKKGSGVATVTIEAALDVALCWGWIDGLRKALDEKSYLQRYTPRRPKSPWSQINRDHVARLTAAGRMTQQGQREVDRARADGRWAAASAPIRNFSARSVPADLRRAIEVSPRALAVFRTLSRYRLFGLAARVTAMRTAAGRARKIAELVAMLERAEPFAQKRK